MSTHEEALDELRSLWREVKDAAREIQYGFFHGGDPRDFSPDPEASTDEERKRHEEACAAWERGERPQFRTHTFVTDDSGNVSARMLHGNFGLGTYFCEDPRAVEWADTIERVIQRLEREDT